MTLSNELLEVLVCPKTKALLVYFPRGEPGTHSDETNGFLLCPTSRLRYRIEGGVPVMLVEEATEVAPDEVERLIALQR